VYHYDPQLALEELTEEAQLPNPAHVRDLMIRSRLSPDQAVDLHRMFQNYLEAFSHAQSLAQSLLNVLVGTQKNS
jgi:hypothetical protein